MCCDSISRIASITKPLTGAVTMKLIEEGKLSLDEPIDRLIPELGLHRVLRYVSSMEISVPSANPDRGVAANANDSRHPSPGKGRHCGELAISLYGICFGCEVVQKLQEIFPLPLEQILALKEGHGRLGSSELVG
jgi:hypothetical protein